MPFLFALLELHVNHFPHFSLIRFCCSQLAQHTRFVDQCYFSDRSSFCVLTLFLLAFLMPSQQVLRIRYVFLVPLACVSK